MKNISQWYSYRKTLFFFFFFFSRRTMLLLFHPLIKTSHEENVWRTYVSLFFPLIVARRNECADEKEGEGDYTGRDPYVSSAESILNYIPFLRFIDLIHLEVITESRYGSESRGNAFHEQLNLIYARDRRNVAGSAIIQPRLRRRLAWHPHIVGLLAILAKYIRDTMRLQIRQRKFMATSLNRETNGICKIACHIWTSRKLWLSENCSLRICIPHHVLELPQKSFFSRWIIQGVS